MGLRVTALQDGKGVLLARQKDSRAERYQHEGFKDNRTEAGCKTMSLAKGKMTTSVSKILEGDTEPTI